MPERAPLIDVRHLRKVFAPRGSSFFQKKGKSVTALEDVSFELHENECLGILGGSGAGKSTIGRILCGLEQATSGECLLMGRPLHSYSRFERARLVQMVFQNPYECLTPTMTAGALLQEALDIRKRIPLPSVGEDARRAGEGAHPHPASGHLLPSREKESLLSEVGLPAEAADWYPHQCSGGQRQRIGIARALALQPKILVADEPLSALDVVTQSQMLQLLSRLREKYRMSVLFITHDTRLIQRLSDRALVLENGRLVESGATASLFQNPQAPYTRRLIEAEIIL